MDKDLKEFLAKQKLLVIATVSPENDPWICNVYFSSDNKGNIYFLTSPKTLHSKHIKEKSKVAFSIPWFNEDNLGDRKAIQGIGKCTKVTNLKEMISALKVHLEKYPSWASVINLKNIQNKVIESRVYKITPSYMKFWDDELYGEEGIKEFNF